MSYHKKQSIQRANILLERRYIINEVSFYDAAKPYNQWYTQQFPQSTLNPKGYKIYINKNGTNVDPISLPEFSEFSQYFKEYPTQNEADSQLTVLITKVKEKQTKQETPSTDGTSGTQGTSGTAGIPKTNVTSGTTQTQKSSVTSGLNVSGGQTLSQMMSDKLSIN